MNDSKQIPPSYMIMFLRKLVVSIRGLREGGGGGELMKNGIDAILFADRYKGPSTTDPPTEC